MSSVKNSRCQFSNEQLAGTVDEIKKKNRGVEFPWFRVTQTFGGWGWKINLRKLVSNVLVERTWAQKPPGNVCSWLQPRVRERDRVHV